MNAADRVAVYGGDAGTLDLWLTVLGDPKAALTVSLLGRGVRTMPVAELEQLDHLGPARAAKVFAAVELGRRLMAEPLVRGKAIVSPQDVVDAFGPKYFDLEREIIAAVYMDIRNRVIADELIAIGTRTQCAVQPADIFRTAVRVGAVCCILVHTHPSSGDPTPSASDDALTKRIAEAGRTVGILLVDHVVIGDGRHYSYAEHRRLQP